ncbi:MAG: ABC transporter substrate-binding protein [Betaproteobacteria bacterium]|nr:ABC transporter substrate-binding protein [Betaproteobacteria bacterium]
MRKVMAGVAALIGMAVGAGAPVAYAQQKTLTISSWGGAFQKAQKEAWFGLVEKELGVTIKEDNTSGIADMRAQVASGKPTWDLSTQGAYSCALLEKEGKLEKFDAATLAVTKDVPSNLRSDYWVSQIVYSVAIGWREKAFGGKKPTGWAAFWDTKNFPGQRSLRRTPIYNLEMALIADGVPMDKLYPLDVDRAFKKLEQIKPHVLVWWGSGAQSAQVLKDGEVDMVSAWNGRIQAIQSEPEGKAGKIKRHLRPADPGFRLLADPQGRSEQGTGPESDPDHDAAGSECADLALHQLRAVERQELRHRRDPEGKACRVAQFARERQEGLHPVCRLVGQ